MLRNLFHALTVLACIAMPLSMSWAASYGQIFDNNGNFYGEIIEKGRMLGQGGYSSVREITLKDAHGVIRKAALREFLPDIEAINIQKANHGWEMLEPIYSEDKLGVLWRGKAGLKLSSGSQVIVSDLANRSVEWISHSLKLDPKDPYFDQKLDLVLKYKRDVLSAMKLLNAHGLAHGDIKFENVLYTTQPGFDSEKPDVSKIHFSLADFDSLKHIGDSQSINTEHLAAPEVVMHHDYRASIPRDLYSHAVSVYSLVFGEKPFEKELKSVKGPNVTLPQYGAELFRNFSDPQVYEQSLKKMDDHFKELERQVHSKASLSKLNELHDFVIHGLKFFPTQRLAALPENGKRTVIKAESKKGCGQRLLQILSTRFRF